eukprot:5103346-Pleurochrysis_carterae.AAC.7
MRRREPLRAWIVTARAAVPEGECIEDALAMRSCNDISRRTPGGNGAWIGGLGVRKRSVSLCRQRQAWCRQRFLEYLLQEKAIARVSSKAHGARRTVRAKAMKRRCRGGQLATLRLRPEPEYAFLMKRRSN